MDVHTDVVSARNRFRLLTHPLIVIALSGCLVFLWLRSFAIEPFDFDESVYRAMAEEMKSAGSWLSQPLFNGEPYNHKPPTYLGVLASFSSLADGSTSGVTAFACRTVSVFFSALTAFVLYRCWRSLTGQVDESRFERRRSLSVSFSPVFFLLMSFLPTAASSAILLDPMLVFFTTLYVCSEAVRLAEGRFSKVLLLGSVLGMTGATATKGLIGLVLPAGAAVLFTLLSHRRNLRENFGKGLLECLSSGLRSFFPSWLLAALCSFLFYLFLLKTGGQAFVEEFFLKHHFGRATAAMEGHDGSPVYYFFVLSLGAGLLCTWLVYAFLIRAQSQSEALAGEFVSSNETFLKAERAQSWLLSWSLFCLIFFSFLATKLPNYIWPVFPALALLGSLMTQSNVRVRCSKFLFTAFRCFGIFSAFALPFAFVLASLVCFAWSPFLVGFVQLKPREDALVSAFMEFSSPLGFGFLGAGVFLLLGGLLLWRWGESSLRRGRIALAHSGGVLRCVSLFQVAACAVLMVVVAPVAEEVLTLPAQRAVVAARMHMGSQERLATSDLYSPNVVSSFGHPVLFGMGQNEWIFTEGHSKVILTPAWNVGLCSKHGYDIVQGIEYLRICLQQQADSLKGMQH
ncbi:MAG: hypothetical protein RIR26_2926 [Pseudomonadota bacterium]|jgi:4-amino-4-deoxy-L-arabinose transferase-like glycosyltransferase